MSNDNKTLADAQPGGRVRLGDQLVLAKLVGAAGLMLAEIDTCGHEVDPAYRRTLYEAWEEGKAALSAQPSPGGQGAPQCWWIDHGTYGQITQRQDEADSAVNAGKRVVTYAARQPVGEPVLWVSPDVLDAMAIHRAQNFPAGGMGLACPAGSATVPLYLAPPAQAVDLGQFRPAVELMEWQERGHANPDFPVGDPKKHAEALRLLALIDSQAVGNG